MHAPAVKTSIHVPVAAGVKDSEEAVPRLAELQQLKSLSLIKCKLASSHLEQLKPLTKLQVLRVSRLFLPIDSSTKVTDISEKSSRNLSGLASCQALVHGVRMSSNSSVHQDADIVEEAGSDVFADLQLMITNPQQVRVPPSLATLERLVVEIGSQSVPIALAGLPHLKHLTLWWTFVREPPQMEAMSAHPADLTLFTGRLRTYTGHIRCPPQPAGTTLLNRTLY